MNYPRGRNDRGDLLYWCRRTVGRVSLSRIRNLPTSGGFRFGVLLGFLLGRRSHDLRPRHLMIRTSVPHSLPERAVTAHRKHPEELPAVIRLHLLDLKLDDLAPVDHQVTPPRPGPRPARSPSGL